MPALRANAGLDLPAERRFDFRLPPSLLINLRQHSGALALSTSAHCARCSEHQRQCAAAFKRVASTTSCDDELSIGLVIDSATNVCVTGWFDGTNDLGGIVLTNKSGGGQDIFVAKYDSSGLLLRQTADEVRPVTGDLPGLRAGGFQKLPHGDAHLAERQAAYAPHVAEGVSHGPENAAGVHRPS